MATDSTSKGDLSSRIKDEARRLGFELVGLAPSISAPTYPRFREWLERGEAAGMSYLERHSSAREHPRSILENVRSVIMVGMVYRTKRPVSTLSPNQGRIAQYAQGTDYHKVLRDRLGELLTFIQTIDCRITGRAVADTAPLLERDFARLAGIGWFGKNTMLINRTCGSFTFLGALLIDRELDFDRPFVADHCGTCTRCLEACPTSAFRAPYDLDARRCISYWTIEHRGPIPEDVAGSLEGWVYGCDICQDVCPWNRKALTSREIGFVPDSDWMEPDLINWLVRDPNEFSRRLKTSAMSRTKRVGLIRNAALVLGTNGVREAIPALEGLREEPDEGVRSAVEWALSRLRSIQNEVGPTPEMVEDRPELKA